LTSGHDIASRYVSSFKNRLNGVSVSTPST
jgi:hypothetical protein